MIDPTDTPDPDLQRIVEEMVQTQNYDHPVPLWDSLHDIERTLRNVEKHLCNLSAADKLHPQSGALLDIVNQLEPLRQTVSEIKLSLNRSN